MCHGGRHSHLHCHLWASFPLQILDRCLMAFPSLDRLVEARHLIKESERTRVQGNDAFARGNYDAAVDSYTAAMKLVEPTNNFRLKGILLANRAAARMAQQRYVIS